MVTDITNYIVEWILGYPDLTGDCLISEDPGVEYDVGIHLAYKQPVKGVLTKTSDEYTYTGIDDRRGNFFYIRHIEEEKLEYSEPENRVSSCLKGTLVTVPLRLVSIVQDIPQATGNERYEVEEFIRNALLNIDFEEYVGTEENIIIELEQGFVNSPYILQEERPEDTEPRGFGLENIFIALDFTLRFKFNAEKQSTTTDLGDISEDYIHGGGIGFMIIGTTFTIT